MRYADFDLYQDLLREKAGLYIGAEKSWWLDSCLAPIAEKWGYPSISSMSIALRGIADPGLIKDVIEAIISHRAEFFRYPHQFDQLRDFMLPHMVMARKETKKLRVWSAGCGTGQEAYSLAIFLKDNASLLGNLKIEVIATDISSTALDIARAGSYTLDEVQRGLSIHQLLKYFDQKDGRWVAKKDLTSLITFSYGNLLENFERLGTFDIIFCRDVLDDIAHDRRERVLSLLGERLAEDGVLFTEPRSPLAS